MTPSGGAKLRAALEGLTKLFFAMAGLAFLFGGGLIHVLTNTDRLLSELEGFGLMGVFLVLGILAKGLEDRLDSGEVDVNGPKSLGEALRK